MGGGGGRSSIRGRNKRKRVGVEEVGRGRSSGRVRRKWEGKG